MLPLLLILFLLSLSPTLLTTSSLALSSVFLTVPVHCLKSFQSFQTCPPPISWKTLHMLAGIHLLMNRRSHLGYHYTCKCQNQNMRPWRCLSWRQHTSPFPTMSDCQVIKMQHNVASIENRWSSVFNWLQSRLKARSRALTVMWMYNIKQCTKSTWHILHRAAQPRGMFSTKRHMLTLDPSLWIGWSHCQSSLSLYNAEDTRCYFSTGCDICMEEINDICMEEIRGIIISLLSPYIWIRSQTTTEWLSCLVANNNSVTGVISQIIHFNRKT